MCSRVVDARTPSSLFHFESPLITAMEHIDLVTLFANAPTMLDVIESNSNVALEIPGMHLLHGTLLYMKRRGLFGHVEYCLFLGPKYVSATMVVRKMQRAFRKRVLIPQARAKINTFCAACSLPSHVRDEVLRQHFKL